MENILFASPVFDQILRSYSMSVFADINRITWKQAKVHILSSFFGVSDTYEKKGVLNVANLVISKRNNKVFLIYYSPQLIWTEE